MENDSATKVQAHAQQAEASVTPAKLSAEPSHASSGPC
jgi:hypothetical protein